MLYDIRNEHHLIKIVTTSIANVSELCFPKRYSTTRAGQRISLTNNSAQGWIALNLYVVAIDSDQKVSWHEKLMNM